MKHEEKLELGVAVAQAVAKATSGIQADLAQSVRSLRLKGALVMPVANVKQSSFSNGALVGFGLYETTGLGPASVILRDGTDASGDIIVPITLAAGESVRDWFGDAGLSFVNGLFVQVVSGAVDGAVYLSGSTG